MATGMRPLQTAIYQKLMASPDLLLLVSGVYDTVPEPAPHPFVSIGAISELPDDTHDAQGLATSVTLHVWSKAPGSSELFDIFAALDAALDRVPLSVAGFRQVSIKHAQHQTIPDPDPRVRHLNAEYRVHMTKE